VEKKIEYYKSLRAFGELNSEEISSAQTEFIELNDKILANKIKRNERLFFLGIDKVDTGAKDLLSMSLPTKLAANCSYQTESVKQIELAIGALETNLQLKNLAHRVDVSASASVSQTRTRQNYSDELRAGLSISVPLYDGGVVDAEKNEVIQKISIENKRLRDAKTIEASELTQRKNTEEVIIASLNSLSKKASNDLSRYYELQKRLDMGESVYIEKSNKRKEYLETLEAFLRLKYDMVEGWFDFLGRLDGFSEI
jgi:outer membrane protein TolC